MPRKTKAPAAAEAVLDSAIIDLDRQQRTGSPEIIYGPGKSPAQMVAIVHELRRAAQSAFATRVDVSQARAVKKAFPNSHHDPVARTLRIGPNLKHPRTPRPTVGVISAGSSDQCVAMEAARTAEFYGLQVELLQDVGVAGLHRLLRRLPLLRRCDILIVVAGMEAALPSVIGGLVACPIIAVPVSNGYGSHFSGLTALLGMLNSCASGLVVVNIDNGFGAAAAASRISRFSIDRQPSAA